MRRIPRSRSAALHRLSGPHVVNPRRGQVADVASASRLVRKRLVADRQPNAEERAAPCEQRRGALRHLICGLGQEHSKPKSVSPNWVTLATRKRSNGSIAVGVGSSVSTSTRGKPVRESAPPRPASRTGRHEVRRACWPRTCGRPPRPTSSQPGGRSRSRGGSRCRACKVAPRATSACWAACPPAYTGACASRTTPWLVRPATRPAVAPVDAGHTRWSDARIALDGAAWRVVIFVMASCCWWVTAGASASNRNTLPSCSSARKAAAGAGLASNERYWTTTSTAG